MYMKPRSEISTWQKMKWCVAALLLLLLQSTLVQAQTDTTRAVTDTVTAAPAPEMISPAVTFSSVQKSDNTIDLKATLKAKVNGQFYNLYGMRIKFYSLNGDTETELGSAITNVSGKVVFNVSNDSLPADAEDKLHFKAVFAGNKAMDPAEEVVEFKKAKLEITPVKEDSLLSVKLKFTEISAGVEKPVKDLAVGVYVKRLFLPQKIGEGTTDENGEATIEFPTGIPGDAKGNLTLIGRIDENDTYGNLEASSLQQWGTPVSDKIQQQPRALWSSHPPLWMLITFIVLMLAVWGHYAVIVLELFRLRKEQPTLPKHATHQ